MSRRRWTVEEKLRLVQETEGMTLRAANEIYGVPSSVLCNWRRSVDKLKERVEDRDKENVPCHLKGAGRPSKISVVAEQELLQYVSIQREKTNKIDVPALLVKLRQIDPFVDQQISTSSSNACFQVEANIRKQIWRILRRNNVATTTHTPTSIVTRKSRHDNNNN